MGSSLAFKTTASLIKPTRETLLDYCSYILLVVSVIGIARVVIGSRDFEYSCFETQIPSIPVVMEKITNGTLSFAYTQIYENNASEKSSSNAISLNFTLDSKKNYMNKDQQNFQENYIPRKGNISKASPPTYCSKYYQAYFPYFLLSESIILLVIGILWVKMPGVQLLVDQFSNLLNESRHATWCKNIANHMQSSSSFGLTFSLQSIFKNNSAPLTSDILGLLEALFQSETKYCSKAEARCIYEKIQKFSYDNENSLSLWTSYIRKSIAQLILWLAMFVVNMVLFVKYEFYVGCDSTATFCTHDTFLRITWFMGQVLVLIYGMCNCVTLKWINEKSDSNSTTWSICKFVCGCHSRVGDRYNCRNSSSSFYRSHPSKFRCCSFSIGEGQRLLHNDMALLFHLVSSSNSKRLPYFTIFLFKEWKEKFSSNIPVAAQPLSGPGRLSPEKSPNMVLNSHTSHESETVMLVDESSGSCDSEMNACSSS